MIEFGLSLDTVLPEKLPENLTWLMLDTPLLGDPPRWPAQPRAPHRALAQLAEIGWCVSKRGRNSVVVAIIVISPLSRIGRKKSC